MTERAAEGVARLRREIGQEIVMKRPAPSMVAGALVLAASLILAPQAWGQSDPLLSWNDGPAKKAIIEFVQATTTQGGAKFVPPAERVATFDQDERAASQSGMYIRWHGDNIWLFVPVQQKLRDLLVTLPEFPFQQASSLNAAGSTTTHCK